MDMYNNSTSRNDTMGIHKLEGARKRPLYIKESFNTTMNAIFCVALSRCTIGASLHLSQKVHGHGKTHDGFFWLDILLVIRIAIGPFVTVCSTLMTPRLPVIEKVLKGQMLSFILCKQHTVTLCQRQTAVGVCGPFQKGITQTADASLG